MNFPPIRIRGSQFTKEMIGRNRLGFLGIPTAMMNVSFFLHVDISYLALKKKNANQKTNTFQHPCSQIWIHDIKLH